MTPPQKVVLVTGASSGIGLATALAEARSGHHLVLAARAEGPLVDAARQCDRAGAASTLVVPTDVGEDASVARLVARTLGEHGRLDVVVNAAGVVAYGRTEEVPVEVFDGVLRTNLVGSVNVARHTLPVLRRQEAGTLVLVGSVIGHLAIPTMSAYAVSKWGVRSLARQLRIENRDLPHVHVRYVAPGGVDTPIYDEAANVAGVPGRPPPPASAAAKAGRQVARRVDHGWLPVQLTVFNYPLLVGFRVLPRLFDATIGSVFPIGATDLTRRVGPTHGNVLRPGGRHALAGSHGSPWWGAARNLVARVRGT